VIAVLGIIITSAYILLVVRRVFFGDMPVALEERVGDVSRKDKGVIFLLSAIMILLGWFPSLLTPLVESGVRHILALVGGA